MENDDLHRVEEVFHDVLGLDNDAREAYLATFPPSDEWLLAEVRSLLLSISSKPDILDEPAFELGLAAIEEPPAALLTGQTIGSYEIYGLLGKGGMGDVYLAQDLRLDRKVALKFLSTAFLNDNWAKRQFVREAQAVAGLDHHNICPVYGYEEIGDHRFIVMQFVDGVSLAELLRNKSVVPNKVPRFALEIVEAIAAAHEHGILHRDIKPGNVMIGSDGHVKVLDFGLAKLINQNDKLDGRDSNLSQATRPGLILGTVAYMSPEQLRAEKLDFRSDIFSLGTVLFELVAGVHPFSKKSDAETISSILEKPTDQIASSKIPSGFRRVINKCVEKEKDKRYQSAAELAIDLQEPGKISPKLPSKFYWRGLVAFLIILIGVVSALIFVRPPRAYSMVVLRYQNETGDADLDYLADGMADSLTTKLGSYSKLRIKTLLPKPGADTNLDPMQVGRENGVDLVLAGKITKQNDQLVLQTNVLDVEAGISVRGWTLPFRPNDLPVLEEEVADQLFAGLKIGESVDSAKPVNRGAVTENGDALRQYLIGRHFWKKRDKDNIQRAIEAFKRSIDSDPGFARSYSGLADSYILLSLVAYASVPTKDAMTNARAAARQALEIDPYDAPAHTSLGIILTRYDWNWNEAEREFRLSLQADPDYSPAHYWYSDLLANIGRVSESIDEAKKAKDLDPFSPQADINLARTYYYARQYDNALGILSNSSALGTVDKKIRYMSGLNYLQKGLYRQAQEIFEKIFAEDKDFGSAALGFTYAKVGRRIDALNLIAKLKQSSADKFVPPQELAIIYIGLGDKDNAFRYLNDSLKQRHSAIVALKVDPLFDSIRNDSRFAELLKGMGLN